MKPAALLLTLALAACATAPDRVAIVQLTNTGTEPLSCKIIYGHWVERDLGPLAPGTTFNIALRQAASDKALYVNRDDGERQMMIENIVCGRLTDWLGTQGQIDLTKARQQDISHLEATCAAPAGAGRVACNVTGIGL
nr:hypothetical protein [uncultured Dongia sp.]